MGESWLSCFRVNIFQKSWTSSRIQRQKYLKFSKPVFHIMIRLSHFFLIQQTNNFIVIIYSDVFYPTVSTVTTLFISGTQRTTYMLGAGDKLACWKGQFWVSRAYWLFSSHILNTYSWHLSFQSLFAVNTLKSRWRYDSLNWTRLSKYYVTSHELLGVILASFKCCFRQLCAHLPHMARHMHANTQERVLEKSCVATLYSVSHKLS